MLSARASIGIPENREHEPLGSSRPAVERAKHASSVATQIDSPDIQSGFLGASSKGSRSDGLPRAVGYCRVSTEGQAQEGISLDAQREKIGAWAIANGYRLVAVYTDAGISGKRADNRPGLQSALDDVCRNGGALVVYSLSRLARSTRDAIAIAERLDKAGADLVSLTERIDTTTAAGKMVFRMLAVLSEFERDLASERTKSALAHKKRKGERLGNVPYGWDVASDGTHLIENPSEQQVISRIRKWRIDGRSLREIARILTVEGTSTKTNRQAWTHQTVGTIVARMLTEPTTEITD